ncbi:MAG: hypothetical protein ACLUNZ_12760 [Evtepia sp.]
MMEAMLSVSPGSGAGASQSSSRGTNRLACRCKSWAAFRSTERIQAGRVFSGIVKKVSLLVQALKPSVLQRFFGLMVIAALSTQHTEKARDLVLQKIHENNFAAFGLRSK